MKRSEINAIIRHMKHVMRHYHFHLPEFAQYTPADWQAMNLTAKREIIDAHLGWDVTDFGLNQFHKIGLTLFTIRNQSPTNNKPYAEKIMLVNENQVTPMHYHWKKMEDIINRSGGHLIVRLYRRNEHTDLPDEHADVQVAVDGESITVPAGGTICLHEGQSICLTPMLYHSFWAQEGKGAVLAGEVSMANDDLTDNRFLEPLGRFSQIEEDEAPDHLLCSDYQTYIKE
ncbi:MULTISPECIES: D-lyxose/D-mannose family sugar isomerase [Pasteurellaceae]|uniref:D-lyxose/D-mannose family sugar isomerase n=1 Tax=Pasteurellaceae TaxID=712 RepID=UPI0005093F93